MRAALLAGVIALFSCLGEAAEGEPEKGRVVLRETGPNRAEEYKVGPGPFYAFRELVRGGKTRYFARLGTTTLTAEDLAAMTKLSEELKGKTSAKDIARATVVFQTTDAKSNAGLSLSYSLDDGSWQVPRHPPITPGVFGQIHKDIAALKAVKPSLDW